MNTQEINSQEQPLSYDLWILVQFLDYDKSFWVLPIYYIENFENYESKKRVTLLGHEKNVWNGPMGSSVSHSTDDRHFKLRPAKIFSIKDSPCCAQRVYDFALLIKEEGSIKTTRIQRAAAELYEPSEDLSVSLSICSDEVFLESQRSRSDDSSLACNGKPYEEQSSCSNSDNGQMSDVGSDDGIEESQFECEQRWFDEEDSNGNADSDEEEYTQFECAQRW